MRSIKRKLTWLIIALLTLITFSAALTGYRSGMQQATMLFDAELKAIAQALVTLPPQLTSEPIDSPAEVAWQRWHEGRLTARSINAPDRMISQGDKGYFDENFLGNRWRVYVEHARVSGDKIIVAHPISMRNLLTENLILSAMTPLIISIPLLALIIYWVVRNSLSPLEALSRQLRLKQRNNLEPINLRNVPTELDAVLQTLNSLLGRLHKAFDRERQFSGNAAHELRTPLSVLKINLHNLLQNEATKKEDIRQCQRDTDRMIHVVNQLLLLSRTNPETVHLQLEPVNLEVLAQKAISDSYDKIDLRQQNIELISDSVFLQGVPFALETLLTNLIENASKYTPESGDIRVLLSASDNTATLRVEDSGPGIDEQFHDAVLSPFYRLPDKHTRQQTGSGLGLAIVNQIVALHHGTLRLSRSDMGGLAVTITLPQTLSDEASL